ncbi:MAG: metal-dependent hydrolase [Patescibacteria group bacterium]|jgi:membrane-bound metal-dependent hydrolase YbcI (DUF457 family)
MYPQTHLLSGIVIGLAANQLGYLNVQETLAVPALTTLLDVDHYLFYSFKYKTLNFRKTWEAAVKNKETGERTAIHHWLGFLCFTLLIIFLFYYYQPFGIILALSYYTHILLDYLPIYGKKIKFKIFNLKFQLTTEEVALDCLFLLSCVILLIR